MPKAIKPAELKIGEAEIQSLPLGYEESEDLLPDIAQIVAQVIESLGAVPDEILHSDVSDNDLAAVGPILSKLAGCLQKGELRRLAPLVLANTTAIAPDLDGVKMRYSLRKLDGEDGRKAFFDLYPETYLLSLFHAGKVTFGRFFPASVMAAALAKLKAAAKTG